MIPVSRPFLAPFKLQTTRSTDFWSEPVLYFRYACHGRIVSRERDPFHLKTGRDDNYDRDMNLNSVGRSMGVLLIATGIAHFVFPKPLDSIVPQFLPGSARTWTYLSGIAELSIAVGLLLPLSIKISGTSIRLIAAYAALILFIAVYPANIKMAIDWRNRSLLSQLLAYGRLPLQFGLFYWAWGIIKALKG